MKIIINLLISIFIVLTVLSDYSKSCAILLPEKAYSKIVDEEAIIVFNPKTQTENFIRRINFDSNSKDVGFIVPTPSIPDLKEVDNQSFENFFNIINTPSIEYNFFNSFIFNNLQVAQDRASVVQTVKIIKEENVGNYNAVVLEATNSVDLNNWLKANGFKSYKSFDKWLLPYIKNNWKITAFKLSNSIKKENFQTKSIMMSFKTSIPFFPYSEPKLPINSKSNARSLRIHVIAPYPMAGSVETIDNVKVLAEDIFPMERTLLGTEHSLLLYSNKISQENVKEFINNIIPNFDIPQENWITSYLDLSKEREINEYTDEKDKIKETAIIELFFLKSDKEPYFRKDKIITINIPSFEIALFLLILIFFIVRLKKKKALNS